MYNLFLKPEQNEGYFARKRSNNGELVSYEKSCKLVFIAYSSIVCCDVVGREGLEPSRLIQPTDFKSVAYTNSATCPGGAYRNRTGVEGFADPCLTPRPTRHKVNSNRKYPELAEVFYCFVRIVPT